MEYRLIMEAIAVSIGEYVKSGEYFADSRSWYNSKYLASFSQRSYSFFAVIIFCALCSGLAFNVISLLPIINKIPYNLSLRNIYQTNTNIIRANAIPNNQLGSIVDIILRNYVMRRESYDYDSIKSQFIFIQNNSSAAAFKIFSEFMNIDNVLSPIMHYQKYVRRTVKILTTTYPTDQTAIVVFESSAKTNTIDLAEDMKWEATIHFTNDQINIHLSDNSKFDFVVTDYQVKLLEDRKNK
jgi:type IV secretion system protein VirB8